MLVARMKHSVIASCLIDNSSQERNHCGLGGQEGFTELGIRSGKVGLKFLWMMCKRMGQVMTQNTGLMRIIPVASRLRPWSNLLWFLFFNQDSGLWHHPLLSPFPGLANSPPAPNPHDLLHAMWPSNSIPRLQRCRSANQHD